MAVQRGMPPGLSMIICLPPSRSVPASVVSGSASRIGRTLSRGEVAEDEPRRVDVVECLDLATVLQFDPSAALRKLDAAEKLDRSKAR
jgi:hypothetical protein